MQRRTATLGFAALFLSACGGGGGVSPPVELSAAPLAPAPAPAPAPGPTPANPAPAPLPAAPLSSSIAMWGDSLTPPVAANLQLFYSDRVLFNGGVAGETSSQIEARELADSGAHANWINVFWYGQNNPKEPERIKADIAAGVASLSTGNRRFMVVSVINKATADEVKGGATYEVILQLNRELAALYPDNFVDARGWLISQFSQASSQDSADVASGAVPSSLRFDEIHLNNDGSVLVALKLREFIEVKRW